MPKQFVNRYAIRHLCVACIMTVLALSNAALAQTGKPAAKPEEIRYAYLDQSIFYYVANERGEQIDGPLLRMAQAVFSKAEVPWRGEPYPAARLFENMKNGTHNFTILVRAPALEECCIFSKKPVISSDLRAYRIGNAPAAKTRDQLRGKSIIVMAGYSYGGLINFIKDPANGITAEVAKSHRAGFEMLKAGRGDYFLDYDGASEQALIDNPVANLNFDVIDKVNLYFVLSKTYPDAEKVMSRLEAVHSTIDMDAILRIRQ